MTDYLEAIVKPLLSEPEAMKVQETTDAMGVLLTFQVAQVDMGFIIGREGANIDKIRKMMALYGTRHEAKISVKVNEPGRQNNPDPFDR